MHCRDIRPLLSAYMDNEVTPEELRVMQRHVVECGDCAATIESYRRMRTAIRALPQAMPPPTLRQAVFTKATPAYRRLAFFFDLGQRMIAVGAITVMLVASFFTASLFLDRGAAAQIQKGPPGELPRIERISPESGTQGWNSSQPVTIVFNKAMTRDSIVAALYIKVVDSPTPEHDETYLLSTLEWEDGDRTVVIGRKGGLRPDTDYYIDIDPVIARDYYDNHLQWSDPRDTLLTSFRTAIPIAIAQATATAAATATHAAATTAAQTTTDTTTAAGATTTVAPTPTAPVRVVVPTTTPQNTPLSSIAVAGAGETPTSPPATPTPAPSTATPMPLTPTVATTPAPPTATPTPKLPFEVVRGFGQLYNASPDVRAGLGLPTANETRVQGAFQQFEQGVMYWRGDTKTIYVLYFHEPYLWYSRADDWTPGMNPGGGAGPKEGQYLPKNGFGKVWRENAEIQQRLGYAVTADEVATPLVIQPFEKGLMLWSESRDGRFIYVLYSNGTFERYQDEYQD